MILFLNQNHMCHCLVFFLELTKSTITIHVYSTEYASLLSIIESQAKKQIQRKKIIK